MSRAESRWGGGGGEALGDGPTGTDRVQVQGGSLLISMCEVHGADTPLRQPTHCHKHLGGGGVEHRKECSRGPRAAEQPLSLATAGCPGACRQHGPMWIHTPHRAYNTMHPSRCRYATKLPGCPVKAPLPPTGADPPLLVLLAVVALVCAGQRTVSRRLACHPEGTNQSQPHVPLADGLFHCMQLHVMPLLADIFCCWAAAPATSHLASSSRSSISSQQLSLTPPSSATPFRGVGLLVLARKEDEMLPPLPAPWLHGAPHEHAPGEGGKGGRGKRGQEEWAGWAGMGCVCVGGGAQRQQATWPTSSWRPSVGGSHAGTAIADGWPSALSPPLPPPHLLGLAACMLGRLMLVAPPSCRKGGGAMQLCQCNDGQQRLHPNAMPGWCGDALSSGASCR